MTDQKCKKCVKPKCTSVDTNGICAHLVDGDLTHDLGFCHHYSVPSENGHPATDSAATIDPMEASPTPVPEPCKVCGGNRRLALYDGKVESRRWIPCTCPATGAGECKFHDETNRLYCSAHGEYRAKICEQKLSERYKAMLPTGAGEDALMRLAKALGQEDYMRHFNALMSVLGKKTCLKLTAHESRLIAEYACSVESAAFAKGREAQAKELNLAKVWEDGYDAAFFGEGHYNPYEKPL